MTNSDYGIKLNSIWDRIQKEKLQKSNSNATELKPNSSDWALTNQSSCPDKIPEPNSSKIDLSENWMLTNQSSCPDKIPEPNSSKIDLSEDWLLTNQSSCPDKKQEPNSSKIDLSTDWALTNQSSYSPLSNIPDSEIRLGIANLFDDYAKISSDHHVIVSFWHECDEVAAWLLCELEIRKVLYDIHLFNHRDESQYSAEIENLIEKHQSKKIIIFVCEKTKLSFSKYLKTIHLRPNITVWRMMNSGPDLFSQSLITKRNDIRQINAWLLSKLQAPIKQSLHYSNQYGTNLSIKLDNEKYSWISSHGFPGENELITLPIGEINTFPAEINGIFVVYGAIHANITLPFNTRMKKNKLTLIIENGIIKDFHSDDKILKNFFTQVFEQDHVNKIAEFGIGTNIGVKNFVADNSHINERFPGVHLGVGQHLQSSDKVSYQTNIHVDFINPYGQLKLQSGEIINLENLKPGDIEHPSNISSEDVESVQI